MSGSCSGPESVARTGEGPTLLVHLASGVGNLVFATPLLVALEELGYAVDLLLHADYPQAADLFRGWSAVREVHAVRFPRGRHYHRLVPAVPPFYWSGLGRMYAGRRDALRRPPDALFYQDEQRYYLEFARQLGWPDDTRPAYTLPVAPSSGHGVTRRTLVIAPGCKGGEMAAKRWPHFAALAERFADVALVGTEDDLRAFDRTPFRFPAHARSFVGRLTLRETAELMAAAGAVVANDSGLGHVAAATGVPTVLLFGPTPERTLGPMAPNVTVLRAGLPCEPCWFTPAKLRACARRVDCLRALPVDDVEREVRRVLGLPADGSASADSIGSADSLDSVGWFDAGDPVDVGDVVDSIEIESVAPVEIQTGDVDRSTADGSRDGSRSIPITVVDRSVARTVGEADEDDPSIPLVSCLMPTRDRRRYVPRAIEHFLRQDHPRRELVVVDDGDRPVEDLVPPDPRVRYHRVERQRTLGGKRNLACSLAKGELLAHWDDDDWMSDRRLSRQVAALLAAPQADVCGLAVLRFFDPAGRQAWEYRWNDPKRGWVAGGTMVYRRTLWERHPFPELNEGEDTRFVWTLPNEAILDVPDVSLYAALVHPNNTSPKRTAGSRWHPIPFQVLRDALGPDWHFYEQLPRTATAASA